MVDDDSLRSVEYLIKLNKDLNSNFPNGFTREWKWEGVHIPLMLHHLLRTIELQQKKIDDLEKMVEILRFVAWKRTDGDPDVHDQATQGR